MSTLSDTVGLKWRRWMVAGLTLGLGACFQHTYHVGEGAPGGEVVHDEWRHHWLGGLISPGSETEVSQYCPSGNLTIEQEMTFLNGLVAVLTSGIYAPTTVKVRCYDRGRRTLSLSVAEVTRIIQADRFEQRVGLLLPDRLEEVQDALEELAR
jgi:mRNA-degrading endonuclease toxin of MazEF toxin-antitoxin module